MTEPDEAVAQIRSWLADGTVRCSQLASLLWEAVRNESAGTRVAYGARSAQLPGQLGYVVVYRTYEQAKLEI